jgi:hypothetical protein
VTALEGLVAGETAGDPMRAGKWLRSSLRQLSRRLTPLGHRGSPTTVGRVLTALDYSLKANVKRLAGADHPDRDRQFGVIAEQTAAFLAAGLPVISVDTKKKELIGNFKQAGRVWCRTPDAVLVHDFPEDGDGRVVPYGIYDLGRNAGAVYVGRSADTPRFAVDAIAAWWQEHGQAAYPTAEQILILADAGGSNGCHFRMWKHQLQTELADRLGLTVTVGHYPAHCSKWNPIEHRLFSFISLNWAGQPLRSLAAILGWIRGTTTTTGLTVTAQLLDGRYPTGETVSDAEMGRLNLERHAVCPTWNYTICPRPSPLR